MFKVFLLTSDFCACQRLLTLRIHANIFFIFDYTIMVSIFQQKKSANRVIAESSTILNKTMSHKRAIFSAQTAATKRRSIAAGTPATAIIRASRATGQHIKRHALRSDKLSPPPVSVVLRRRNPSRPLLRPPLLPSQPQPMYIFSPFLVQTNKFSEILNIWAR